VQEPFEVRLRPVFPGFTKAVGWVATVIASGLFLGAGAGSPASAYGALFLTFGVLGALFALAMVLYAVGPLVSDRPAVALSQEGVRVLRPWPLPAGDRHLPWSDVAVICAWSQGPPTGGRGAALNQPYLSFLPPKRDTPLESGAEILATKVAGLGCEPTLRYTARVRPTWQTSLDDLAAEATRRAPHARFADRRETLKPPRRRRRVPSTRR
jgi:hypothetical protein